MKNKMVFTNGCFDLLHPGHIDLLERARALGDMLVVGLNSDVSVRTLKGPHKPYLNQNDRKRMLLALRAVDAVMVFDELDPARLIHDLRPDVLVKGGDWPVAKIIGSDFVRSYGGEVYSLPLLGSYSSTAVAEQIREQVPDLPALRKAS